MLLALPITSHEYTPSYVAVVTILCDTSFFERVQSADVDGCTCLNGFDQTAYLTAGGLAAPVENSTFLYPYNYGLVSCQAHDYSLPPFCNGTIGQVSEFCLSPWCYVNLECPLSVASVYFEGLFFSYSFCEQSGSTVGANTRRRSGSG